MKAVRGDEHTTIKQGHIIRLRDRIGLWRVMMVDPEIREVAVIAGDMNGSPEEVWVSFDKILDIVGGVTEAAEG